jgi:hypothetical protein
MAAEIPPLRTRRPSGKPPWPMILLAGAEKCGKSYSAAAFSASDLIDRTFWVEIGEGAADQYGALPGARYEIVEHDGTYQGIGRAIYAATMQPRENGRPHAIVVDSMTELWDLLSDEAQQAANRRKGKGHDGEVQITMDLWNVAKKRWRRVIDLLRTYDGPVILTSRLEQVAVMATNGQPTTAKALKIRAEKNLGYEVDAIVQIPEPRQYQLTGVRSVHWNRAPGEAMDYPDFTVDALLRKLGLAEAGATGARSYTAPRTEQSEQLTPEDAAEAVVRKAQREQPEPRQMVDIAPRRGHANPFDPDFELPPTVRPMDERERTWWTQKIAILCAQKRGISGKSDEARQARLGVIEQICKLKVASSKELPRQACALIVERLELEPDYVPEVVEGEVTPQMESLAADYAAAIDEVDNEAELDAVVATVDGAVAAGQLMPDQGNELLAAAGQRRGGWSHRVLEAQTGVAA